MPQVASWDQGPLATPCNRGCCVAWPDGDDTPRKWPSWAGAPTHWLGSEGVAIWPRVPGARFWHSGTREVSGTWHLALDSVWHLALWHSRHEWHLALWHSNAGRQVDSAQF